jgi:hypothetical protein
MCFGRRRGGGEEDALRYSYRVGSGSVLWSVAWIKRGWGCVIGVTRALGVCISYEKGQRSRRDIYLGMCV